MYATVIGMTGKPGIGVLCFPETLEMAGCITPGLQFRPKATNERCRHVVDLYRASPSVGHGCVDILSAVYCACVGVYYTVSFCQPNPRTAGCLSKPKWPGVSSPMIIDNPAFHKLTPSPVVKPHLKASSSKLLLSWSSVFRKLSKWHAA